MWIGPSSGSYTASVFGPPQPAARLSVTKTDSPDPVTAGSSLSYRIRVSNAGPGTAANVTLFDPPGRVTFVSASTSQGTCSWASYAVRCALGQMSRGMAATVDIVVKPQNAGTLSNTVTVYSPTPDPNSRDNSATATTTVQAPPTGTG